MKLETRMHTILLLIGPSNCGKSTFVEKLVKSNEYYPESTFKHISSDNIRRSLIGENLHKHDPKMMYVSEQAFDILFNQLKNHTAYPVNTPIVIVDTTGLAEDFRNKVIDVAKENNYNIEAVIFDYKDNQDYYAFLSENDNKMIVAKHVKKLRIETLPRTSLKNFNKIHKIRSIDDLNNISVVIEDYELFDYHKLSNIFDYEIIGDIHSNIDALKAIISKTYEVKDNIIKAHTYNESNKDKQFILIGDWIDKGTQTKETIDFIYNNIGFFILVKGNHENFVYKYLKGELEELPDQNLIDTYFNSIKDFEKDEELKIKFFHLYEMSREFFIHDDFIVTHAPCQNKYLGKLGNRSLRNQRYVNLPKREDFENEKLYTEELEKTLFFLKNESASNMPIHVFGHVAFNDRLIYKNKYGIDTGAGDNNKLTSVQINGFQKKPFFSQINVDDNKTLPTIFKLEISIKDISEEDMFDIKKMAKNKVNYISGTMSPADKDLEKFELESLEKGLNYYKENGIEQVILEPKYMGSRCQIYLFRDVNKCYAVSRNGFRISHVNLQSEYERLIKKYFKESYEMIMLDGELMPWFALGKGLIENQYNPINISLQKENEFLNETNFDKMLFNIEKSEEYSNFREDSITNKINKQDLIAKYGHSKYETYSNLIEFEREYSNSPDRNKLMTVYDEQLKLYAQDSEIEYKPFDILKIRYKDGRESIVKDPVNNFKQVSDDIYAVIDFGESDYLETATKFYNEISTDLKMEGIVIKPEFISDKYAPYIKVRNKNYLTLIYGYDYSSKKKYEKLINQKNISRKLKLSIKEHNLTMKLLEIPYDKLSFDNAEYVQLLAKLVADLRHEKELDPRL